MVLGALLAGCGGITLPDAPPTVEGTVDGWDAPFPGSITTFIGVVVDATGCLHSTFVSDNTDFALRRADGSTTRGTFRDLKRGQPIRVWTTEPVSGCPSSSTAVALEVEIDAT